MIYVRNTEEQVDGWTQGHRECGFRPGAKIVMLSCWNGPACRVGPVPGLAREVVEELETESNRCY